MSRPPPSYGAFCVLYGLLQVVGHAARHRAAQAAQTPAGAAAKTALNAASSVASSSTSQPPPTSDSSAEVPNPKAAELRRQRLQKLRQERAADEEEFRRILNKRWEERDPRDIRNLEPIGLKFDLEDIGATGTVEGSIRANDVGPDVVEVEGRVEFKVQLKTPPRLEEEEEEVCSITLERNLCSLTILGY